MLGLLAKSPLPAPRQQLLHPPRLAQALGLDVLEELGRVDLAVRNRAVPVFDQRARPPPAHAHAAPPPAAGPRTSFLAKLLVAVVDRRVAEGERYFCRVGVLVKRRVDMLRRRLDIVVLGWCSRLLLLARVSTAALLRAIPLGRPGPIRPARNS